MSSTEFNVGLSERNVRKSLRPPGGYSNIFGFGGNEEETPQVNPRNQTSEIKSCLQFDDTPSESQKIKDEQKGENEKKGEENKTETPNKGTQRVRVPPGGFSSGLW